MTGDGRKPTWSLILQFEHEARKAAYKWLRDGEVTTLDAAFSRAMVDTEVLQRHLIIPFSLNVSARTSDDMPNTWVERPPRGGRGRGRGNAGRGNAARGARNQQLKNSNQASEFKGKLTKDATGNPFVGVSIARGAAATHHAGSNMCANAASRMPMRTSTALWSNAPQGGTDSSAPQEGMALLVQMTAPFACFTCVLAHPLGASWGRGLRKTHLVAASWWMNSTCHYLIPILMANIAGRSLCRTFRRVGTTWFCCARRLLLSIGRHLLLLRAQLLFEMLGGLKATHGFKGSRSSKPSGAYNTSGGPWNLVGLLTLFMCLGCGSIQNIWGRLPGARQLLFGHGRRPRNSSCKARPIRWFWHNVLMGGLHVLLRASRAPGLELARLVTLVGQGWIKKAVIEDLYPGTVVMTTVPLCRCQVIQLRCARPWLVWLGRP